VKKKAHLATLPHSAALPRFAASRPSSQHRIACMLMCCGFCRAYVLGLGRLGLGLGIFKLDWGFLTDWI